MADEEYGDDGFYFDDDDYLYVEDAFAVAVSPILPHHHHFVLLYYSANQDTASNSHETGSLHERVPPSSLTHTTGLPSIKP
jgi:hypothetical protein